MTNLAHIKESLNSSDSTTRCRAVQTLGEFTAEQALPYVLPMLEDSKWDVRREACRTAAHLGDDRAAEAVARLLTDEDWMVREAAATALADLDDASLVEKLTKASEDEVYSVRKAAKETLERLGYTIPTQAGNDEISPTVPQSVHASTQQSVPETTVVTTTPAEPYGALKAHSTTGTTNAIEAMLKGDVQILAEMLSASLNARHQAANKNIVLIVPISGGRTQKVLLIVQSVPSNNEHETKAWLTCYTECGPANTAQYEWALRQNARLTSCRLAVVDTKNETNLVLMSRTDAKEATVEKLIKIIKDLAVLGDRFEKELTGGQDIR